MGSLEEVTRLNDEIYRRLGDAKISIDRPADPNGHWWIDVEQSGLTASVEFRPGQGFGVAAPHGGYGEGPDVVVSDASTAADQVVAFLVATRLLEGSPTARLFEDVRRAVDRAVEKRFQSMSQELIQEIGDVSKQLRQIKSDVAEVLTSPRKQTTSPSSKTKREVAAARKKRVR
jgi:hypothetical protein